jgi:hypothetical protein
MLIMGFESSLIVHRALSKPPTMIFMNSAGQAYQLESDDSC